MRFLNQAIAFLVAVPGIILTGMARRVPRCRGGCRANGVMLKMPTMLAVLAVSGLVSRPAGAAPIYKLDHYTTTFPMAGHAPGGDVGPQPTPITYDFPFQSVNPGQDTRFSEAQGHVGTGFMTFFNRTVTELTGPQGQSIQGEFLFDVVFNSPTSDPIDVSMNVELAATHAMGPIAGQAVLRTYTTLGTPILIGQYLAHLSPIDGFKVDRIGNLSNFTADGTVQPVGLFHPNVPVNQPVQFRMKLDVDTAHSDLSENILIVHTFRLSTSGPVFGIGSPVAGDIIVTSTDANIVNNVFIPETCTLQGDLNQDSVIDGKDIDGYLRAKLNQLPEPGEEPTCADFGTGTLDGDTAAFLTELLN